MPKKEHEGIGQGSVARLSQNSHQAQRKGISKAENTLTNVRGLGQNIIIGKAKPLVGLQDVTGRNGILYRNLANSVVIQKLRDITRIIIQQITSLIIFNSFAGNAICKRTVD